MAVPAKTITQEQFKELPQAPQNWNPALDMEGLRKKYSGPPRSQVWTGVFSLPLGVKGEVRKGHLKKNVEKFVTLMGKRGFKLLNKPVVNGPYPYRDLDSVVLLDKQEYRILATFAPKPQPIRMEVAVA